MIRVLIFILVFVHTHVFSQKEEQKLIPWKPDYKLTWDDFKGYRKDSMSGLAAICAEIDVFPHYRDKSLIYKVTNNFKSYVSFVDSSIFELNNVVVYDLLEHEQIHFDIAEIHTRLIRKRLFELTLNNSISTDRYMIEVEKILEDRIEMNGQYDNQSSHGIILSKQHEWREKVQKQLVELEPFYESNIRNNGPHNNVE